MRRWHVYCSQFTACRWDGYRRAEWRSVAIQKPCPRCGNAVVA